MKENSLDQASVPPWNGLRIQPLAGREPGLEFLLIFEGTLGKVLPLAGLYFYAHWKWALAFRA